MKTLYLDCFSGISGDMFIGALLDAGGDAQRMQTELQKLNIEEEYTLQWSKVNKNGITATKFDVHLQEADEKDHDDHHHVHEHSQVDLGAQEGSGEAQYDHDGAHLHSHSHKHDHDHSHEHHHGHDHSHDHVHDHHHDHAHDHHEHIHHHHDHHPHTHDHLHHDHTHHHHSHDHSHSHGHHHHHHHRAYKDIVQMIEAADFEEPVRDTALRIFKIIGEAEGKIHGVTLDDVHFHEVGAVDSIVDIVGASILIHQMGIEAIHSSPVPVGMGKIRIDHGIYPVPAPATLEILKGVPLEASDVRFELTTPTGAAIVSVLAQQYGPIPSIKVSAVGYGAGTKTFADRPNVLRVIVGE
ncbi:LarC family nickel insertion protein [Paenibacillus favisporus]|uniref:LarC family nickel insertion protein n=1 Tax=Paenibacillus favisporus TaxID=221028 RepID=UPI002DBF468C|nr:LarC family nickel insertion protein [Paenibacillus favisporus]MEC0174090.1 LarC family nickel insertion protein [Paenibacillus favisporus]